MVLPLHTEEEGETEITGTAGADCKRIWSDEAVPEPQELFPLTVIDPEEAVVPKETRIPLVPDPEVILAPAGRAHE